jgi:hypothetical protein
MCFIFHFLKRTFRNHIMHTFTNFNLVTIKIYEI